MTKKCKCYVLNVGQGSATFVLVYDNGSGAWKPVTSVLTDLGSGTSNYGTSSYSGSINLIEAELNSMTGGASLDLLVLSHSDNDHINLVGRLLDKYSPDGKGGKPKLVIKKVVYGGWYAQYKKKGSGNILDKIEPYLADKTNIDKTLVAAPACASGFSFTGATMTETTLINANGLTVTTLIMNAPTPTTQYFKDDIKINTRSVVVVATYYDKHKQWVNFIITGDATGPTFVTSRDTVFSSPNRLKDRLAGTYLMTVPHHGAARTATCYTVPGTTGADAQWKAADNFIDDCLAQTAVASAGDTSHRHPRWSLLSRYLRSSSNLQTDYYIDPNLPPTAGHLYTAYYSSGELDTALGTTGNKDSYACFATQPSMFTTYYFYPKAYKQAIYPNPSKSTAAMPKGDDLFKKVPIFVYWTYEVDDTDTVVVKPEKFTLGTTVAALSPFMRQHPSNLAREARTLLHAQRMMRMPALTPVLPASTARTHVLA